MDDGRGTGVLIVAVMIIVAWFCLLASCLALQDMAREFKRVREVVEDFCRRLDEREELKLPDMSDKRDKAEAKKCREEYQKEVE